MDDHEFTFEERKQENRKYNNINDMEFNKGGGGGGPRGFFTVKTNVYSKECYSDPNNPGKMICKETNNLSGYDPFNSERNYNRSKENVYTRDYNGNQNHDEPKKEKSFMDKMYYDNLFINSSGKIKGIFSSNYDENGNKSGDYNTNYYNSSTQFNNNPQTFITSDQQRYNHQYVRDNDNKNYNQNNFLSNDNYGAFSRDPIFDEFEKIINNIHSSFFRGGFFDDDGENQSRGGFGNFFGGGFPFEKDRDDDFENFFHNINFHRSPSHFSEISSPFVQNEFQNGFNYNQTNYDNYNNLNNSKQGNQFPIQSNQNDPQKEIKFRDSKIYDV
jgi:hypothetical protein